VIMMNRGDPPERTVFARLGNLPQVAALIDWTLVRLDVGSDSIQLSFTAAESFTNPAGSVHGGFIAAMLDECMGSAIVGLTDAQFLPATVSVTTDVIRPVRAGKVEFRGGHGRATYTPRHAQFLGG
jgi:uncharacterized protein (TIGR00369 family)